MDIILGYVGLAFAGKDTVSRLVVEQIMKRSDSPITTVLDNETAVRVVARTINGMTYKFFHVPLALGVKQEYVRECLHKGLDVDLSKLLYDEAYKGGHREGLIRIGDGRRKDAPLHWVDKVQETIRHLMASHEADVRVFSITDMRYENELPCMEAYCEAKGIPILSIKVETELVTLLRRMKPEHVVRYLREYHINASERNVKRVHGDIVIDNNGTQDALLRAIVDRVLPVFDCIAVGAV